MFVLFIVFALFAYDIIGLSNRQSSLSLSASNIDSHKVDNDTLLWLGYYGYSLQFEFELYIGLTN